MIFNKVIWMAKTVRYGCENISLREKLYLEKTNN